MTSSGQLDKYVSEKIIKLEFEERKNKATLYERCFVNKLFRDGKLKKTSGCQYAWQMIYYHILLVLIISVFASLFMLFNYFPIFIFALAAKGGVVGSTTSNSTSVSPSWYLLVVMLWWLYGWIRINLEVYIEDWGILPLYFDGILGDKLQWFHRHLTHSMTVIHPAMVHDAKYKINNISAIRGAIGARNNRGIENSFRPQEVDIEINDEKKENVNVKIDHDVIPHVKIKRDTPQSAKRKARVRIRAQFEGQELFVKRLDGWRCKSVCSAFCAYWIIIIIWAVFVVIAIINVIDEYNKNDWDEKTLEEKLYDALNDKMEDITDGKPYEFWTLGVLMTPVWFFACESIYIFVNFQRNQKNIKQLKNRN